MYEKSLAIIFALTLSIFIIGCDVEDTTSDSIDEQDALAAPSIWNPNRVVSKANPMDSGDLTVDTVGAGDSVSLLPFGRINLVSQYIGPDPATRYPENKVVNVGDHIDMSLWVTTKRAGYVKFIYVWVGEDEALIFPESSGDAWHCLYLPDAGTYNLSLGLDCPDKPGNWSFFGGVKFAYAPWLRDWGIYAPGPFPFVITDID